MPIKENHPNLFALLEAWFSAPPAARGIDLRYTMSVSAGHGRVEKRELIVTTVLKDYIQWPDVQQIMCLTKTTLDKKSGQVSIKQRYALTSLTPDLANAGNLLALWREHWCIENHLHYKRDVFLREDDSRIHADDRPAVMATLRNAILNLCQAWGYTSLKQAREQFAIRPQQALGLIELPVDVQLE
jgi:predicted transposase YbfD/YdcC